MPEIKIEYPNSCAFKYFQPARDLYLQYTTRQCWSLKRNVQVDGGDTHPSDANNKFPLFIYSYQNQDHPEVELQVQKAVKVLASGRDGRLLSWQKETSLGIEDTSGELRADTRPQWSLFYYPAIGVPMNDPSSGLDIVSTKPDPISQETVDAIQKGIENIWWDVDEFGTISFFKVPDDGARNQERKMKDDAAWKKWVDSTGPQYERPTGASVGRSPTLRYDDDEPEKGGKCLLQ
ncbi:hypothetical protein BGZ60DRAFT_527118 [Tricladium varicosporioides]|nr:hypothetical protein BGZ60DRAFT_527118 [Hymenoscyphus varicosporioides]